MVNNCHKYSKNIYIVTHKAPKNEEFGIRTAFLKLRITRIVLIGIRIQLLRIERRAAAVLLLSTD